jgi:hypothetical protein
MDPNAAVFLVALVVVALVTAAYLKAHGRRRPWDW